MTATAVGPPPSSEGSQAGATLRVERRSSTPEFFQITGNFAERRGVRVGRSGCKTGADVVGVNSEKSPDRGLWHMFHATAHASFPASTGRRSDAGCEGQNDERRR